MLMVVVGRVLGRVPLPSAIPRLNGLLRTPFKRPRSGPCPDTPIHVFLPRALTEHGIPSRIL